MNPLNFEIEEAVNEPIKGYLPGSSEKASLKTTLDELKSQRFDIPIIINGQEIRTGNTGNCVMPHNHQHILATYHKAGEKEIKIKVESGKIFLTGPKGSKELSINDKIFTATINNNNPDFSLLAESYGIKGINCFISVILS